MAPEITDPELQNLLNEGLSQNEIARQTGIPRSTLRRRLQALGTPQVTTSVPESENERAPELYQGIHAAAEIAGAWAELQEMLAWWRERKHALQSEQEPDQETQRQTYHVQKRYIEAIKRAADLEHVSIMEIVNRALGHYFNREHD
jgi:response regulator of citrate/malate metabolism